MTDKITNWTVDEVISVFRSLAKEDDLPAHLIEGEITGQDSVDTLGIDSLGGAFLVERLEELSGVQLPDDFFALEDNIAAIATRLTSLVEKTG